MDPVKWTSCWRALRRFKGITPVECMGGVTFPPIGEFTYLLTLPGHGFYWFQLAEPLKKQRRGRCAASGARHLW